jgi:ubiquinone biosynthesis O-methyltransferase
LHQINPLRLEWIDRLAAIRGKRTLDVGCSGGILAEAMAHRGAVVKRIDLAVKSLRMATLHAQSSRANVSYQVISAEELAQQEPEAYGVVTCMEILEHVPRPVPFYFHFDKTSMIQSQWETDLITSGVFSIANKALSKSSSSPSRLAKTLL